jgi:hypothetical protein
MAGLGFDDMAPRVISSKKHAVIDYIHAGTNLAVAAIFRNRDPKASWAALALGVSVLGNALMTDYELGVFRLYSFKTHGILDYAVAAASAAIPALLDLDSAGAKAFFYAQGGGETGIAAISDYDDDSGARRARRRIEPNFSRAA